MKKIITHWDKCGYNKIAGVLNNIFNFFVALFFFIVAFPLFILIAILIKFSDGGGIFYKGKRLGLHKKLYTMYKFRTLVPGAERVIGAQLLSRKLTQHRQLETKIGPFLRDTRLDELPQLINVLLGQMDMVGPRPVRPVIYDKFCKHLDGYDRRFIVKPGLIGYSQLFTPHSTPKRIRAYIDTMFLQRKQKLTWDILFVVYAFATLLKKAIFKLATFVNNRIIKSKMLGLYSEKRVLERVPLKNAKAYLNLANWKEGKIVDINEDAILVFSDADIDVMQDEFSFKMEINEKRNNRQKRNTAYCVGELFRKVEIDMNDQFPFGYVIKYKPISRYNEYVIQQYFLYESIVS